MWLAFDTMFRLIFVSRLNATKLEEDLQKFEQQFHYIICIPMFLYFWQRGNTDNS